MRPSSVLILILGILAITIPSAEGGKFLAKKLIKKKLLKLALAFGGGYAVGAAEATKASKGARAPGIRDHGHSPPVGPPYRGYYSYPTTHTPSYNTYSYEQPTTSSYSEITHAGYGMTHSEEPSSGYEETTDKWSEWREFFNKGHTDTSDDSYGSPGEESQKDFGFGELFDKGKKMLDGYGNPVQLDTGNIFEQLFDKVQSNSGGYGSGATPSKGKGFLSELFDKDQSHDGGYGSGAQPSKSKGFLSGLEERIKGGIGSLFIQYKNNERNPGYGKTKKKKGAGLLSGLSLFNFNKKDDHRPNYRKTYYTQ